MIEKIVKDVKGLRKVQDKAIFPILHFFIREKREPLLRFR